MAEKPTGNRKRERGGDEVQERSLARIEGMLPLSSMHGNHSATKALQKMSFSPVHFLTSDHHRVRRVCMSG